MLSEQTRQLRIFYKVDKMYFASFGISVYPKVSTRSFGNADITKKYNFPPVTKHLITGRVMITDALWHSVQISLHNSRPKCEIGEKAPYSLIPYASWCKNIIVLLFQPQWGWFNVALCTKYFMLHCCGLLKSLWLCARQAVYWTGVFQHWRHTSEFSSCPFKVNVPQRCQLRSASYKLLCIDESTPPAWESKCNPAHFCKVKLTSLSTYWRLNIVRGLSWNWKANSVPPCESAQYVEHRVSDRPKRVIAGVRWARGSVAAKLTKRHLVSGTALVSAFCHRSGDPCVEAAHLCHLSFLNWWSVKEFNTDDFCWLSATNNLFSHCNSLLL